MLRATNGVDYIIHAAALKQGPSCEFVPLEAVKTNIIGTDNVLTVAQNFEVKKVVVLSTVFERDPDVVAETLFRSNGICGRCMKPAPFNRKKDGRPYLEVHHLIPLSKGGSDELSNVIALCPNCHRESHFG